jgi:5-methylcytosine-specific restriction endonuclease McrBC regulatory subunit McrC
VPIDWSRRSVDALSSLIPDFVIRLGDHIFSFDAKYKGHFEEFDQQRWVELRDELHAEHRHDVHQVLAYAALYGANAISAALIYPMRLHQWDRLRRIDQTIISASLTQAGRQLNLRLIGVPIHLSPTVTPDTVIHAWHAVR